MIRNIGKNNHQFGISICLLILLSFSACKNNAQSFDQLVSYKGIDLKLPSSWNYKSQELQTDFAYQISAWDIESGNSFVFQWIETEMDLSEYLELMKKSLKNQISHKDALFTYNKTGDFRNIKTMFTTFSLEVSDVKYNGRIIAFSNGGRSFLIMVQGVDEFYRTQTADNIISSLNISFFQDTGQALIPTAWTLYEIEKIGQIAVPPSLELRDDNSFTALAVDILSDSYLTHKKIKLNKSQLVFQPNGTDKFEKEALSKYSRILINYSKGSYGDFYSWNEV